MKEIQKEVRKGTQITRTYETPVLGVVPVRTEAGFAASGMIDDMDEYWDSWSLSMNE